MVGLIFFLQMIWAQTPAAPPQEGQVVVEQALLYSQADFDSQVLAQVPKGTKVKMSNRLFGAFYRVQLPDKKVGFMTDVDVRSTKAMQNKSKKQAVVSRGKRFRGGTVNWIGFREDVIDGKNQATMTAFGLRFVGEDLLGPESYPLDILLQIAPQAPAYYKNKTGVDARGYLFLSEFLFQQSGGTGRTQAGFGFGPMIRYSHFDVGLPQSSGATISYSMDDLIFGLAFGAGVGVKLQDWLIRVDARMYWERLQYFSVALGLMHAF